MKRNLLFILVTLMSMMGAQIAANAQDLTLSDVQNSGCMQSTRAKANRDEVMPSIILTKEGSILTVQLFNYEANCGTTGFDVVPSISGGSDGSPLSVSISVVATGGEEEDCICPYNISFTIHGLETNSFYFSCVGYEGQVDLTEGEPYELWEVTDVIIDGVTYRLNRKKKTATLITGRTVEGKLNIPAEVSYGGQTCTVTSIDYFAFTYNTNLTAVSIPGSVTSISVEAFYYCENLKDVYCYAANVPNTANNAFTGIPASATLHVPAGSVDKYKATAPWNGFGNIVATPIEINETTFPDENFRNWVLAQSYGQDGVLTHKEIAGVTTINVMEREVILSLKGIEYFTALTKLTCQRNKLTELDLSKNIALTWLNCYGNNLAELDLSNNKKLTYLACEGNHLTSLDVSDCTELTELDCQQNKLATLNASGCKALTMLKCYMNQLTTLELSGCSSLEAMWCNDNQLSSLDVSGCISLTVLRCHGNQLSKINVSTNTKLTHFWCQDNQLTSLNVSKNKKLTELRTYHNQISGEAMDALIESLPIVSKSYICAVLSKDELGVMTTTQAVAAKAKGWIPMYWNDIDLRWQEYTGSEPTELVTFTQDQMATIILPTVPDAGKGKYYRLDRCEDNQIIFEQELQPQARTPYIIVPSEDFSINPNTLDLEGLTQDAVSIDGISFIGTYTGEVLPSLGGEGSYYDIIDTTPDCQAEEGKAFLIGALRAYLLVNWDDPINHPGSKDPKEKMPIVLKDKGTSLSSLTPTLSQGEGDIYDVSGRRVNAEAKRGVYIENGKKWVKYHK